MAHRCREPRQEPQIPIRTIFLLVVLGLCLRKRSFHQMDQWARLSVVRRLLGSRRPMVASDATLWRVLPVTDVHQAREYVRQTYHRWKARGPWRFTLPSGRTLRLGIVDGSQFGNFYASCLQIRADRGDFFLDLEVCGNKGHERQATQKLLERVAGREGKGFVDLILSDGLYIAEPFLRHCTKLGLGVLVKSKEEEQDRLDILKDARRIFDSSKLRKGIEEISGVDAERGVCYRVQAAAGFRHGEFPGTLKVARVQEEFLKPRPRQSKRQAFWVITTEESLSAADLRELAHERWSVENQGFKMLSAQVNSKHVWTRGEKSRQTFEILMLWMFLAFGVVKAYEASLEEEELWKKLRLRKLTMEFMVRMWETSLGEAPALLPDTG